jgi:hypothetical protein
MKARTRSSDISLLERTRTKQDNERHKEDNQALKLDPAVDRSFDTNLLGFSPITLARREENKETNSRESGR